MANVSPRNRRTADLHPFIYRAMIGLMGVWVLAAWLFIGGQGYSSLVLGVVTLFGIITVAIPSELWRIWHRHEDVPGHAIAAPGPFKKWLNSDIDVWQVRMKGRDVAFGILLPLVAVCVEALIFAVVFHMVSNSVGH